MSSRLAAQYPDFTQSVIQTVTATCKSEEEARRRLAEMSGNVEPSEQEKHKKLAELGDQYQALGNETILRVLRDCQWDVDKAVLPLFNLLTEMQNEPNKNEAHKMLSELFTNLSKEEIQKLLDDHDNDPDAVADFLLNRGTPVEDPETKRQKEQDAMISTLMLRFPGTSREDCVSALQRAHWLIADAVAILTKKKKEAKVRSYMVEYPSLTASEISGAIMVNDLNGEKTRQALDQLVKEKATGGIVSPANPEKAAAEEAEAIAAVTTQVNNALQGQNAAAVAKVALATTLRLTNQPGVQAVGAENPTSSPAQGPAIFGPTLAVLALLQTEVNKGDKIIVSWSHSSPTSGDWIGLYNEEEVSEKSYLTYQWVDVNSREVTFTAPHLCGRYKFRYFHNKTYTSQGTSPAVVVGPQFSLETTKVSTSELGVKVTQLTGNECPNLWVALYKHGEMNPKSYEEYKWAKVGQELTFAITKAGTWHFKVFPDRGYDHALIHSVNVPGKDSLVLRIDKERNKAIVEYEVTTVAPATDSVWIGIFNVDQQDCRYYRRYKYVYDQKGEFEVKAMQTKGTYEARLFAKGTYDVLCKSSTRVTVD